MVRCGIPATNIGKSFEISASSIFNVLDLLNARSKADKSDFGGTYNGFKASGHRKIDHIYYKDLSVLTFQVLRDSWNSITYISDHYPVISTFNFSQN